MASVIACPDQDTLRRLLLGQLAGGETDRLAQHVEQCERCASALRALSLTPRPELKTNTADILVALLCCSLTLPVLFLLLLGTRIVS
jgi:hypothetical protein